MLFFLIGRRDTFGDIGGTGEVLVVGILIEEGDLIGLDVLIEIANKERVIPLEQFSLLLFDMLLGHQEDLP